MIYHVVFCKVSAETDATLLEQLIRSSRSLLLKIPEVLAVRSGRNIDPGSQWQFFVATEYESLDRKAQAEDHPVFFKFQKEIIDPTLATFTQTYETDPSKELKYS